MNINSFLAVLSIVFVLDGSLVAQLPSDFEKFADKQTCFVFQLDLASEGWSGILDDSLLNRQTGDDTIDVGQHVLLKTWQTRIREGLLKLKSKGVKKIVVYGKIGAIQPNQNLTVAIEVADEVDAKRVGQELELGSDVLGSNIVMSRWAESIVSPPSWRYTLSSMELEDWRRALKPTRANPIRLTVHLTEDQARVLLPGTPFEGLHSLDLGLDTKRERIDLTVTSRGKVDDARRLSKRVLDEVENWCRWQDRRTNLPLTTGWLSQFRTRLKVDHAKKDVISYRGSREEFIGFAASVHEMVSSYLLNREMGKRVVDLRRVNKALLEFRKEGDWRVLADGVATGTPPYSWRVGVLPWLNETAYYLDRKLAWDNEANRRATQWAPSLYPFDNQYRNQRLTQMNVVLDSAWVKSSKLTDGLVCGTVVNSKDLTPQVWTRPIDVSVGELLTKVKSTKGRGTWVGLSNGKIAFIPKHEIELLSRLFKKGVSANELSMLPDPNDQLIQLIPSWKLKFETRGRFKFKNGRDYSLDRSTIREMRFHYGCDNRFLKKQKS